MTPDALFRPFNLKGLALPNRVALAPMSRHRAVDGVPGPDSAAYYKRRAEAGVGLIITEGTFLDHPASGDTTTILSLASFFFLKYSINTGLA